MTVSLGYRGEVVDLKPKVSIIIPSYNRAGLLGRALRSVQAQTYASWELLIIDDGSNDNTKELVEEFCKSDKRIRYFKPWDRNKGVSASRNYGIKLSKGELIAFLDSDDEWLVAKLEKQVELYDREQYLLCHSDEIWIRNGLRVNQMKKHKKSGGDVYLNCLPLCCISPSASIIRASVFDDLGLFDESYPVCEDYDLWLRLCAREKVSFIDEALIIKHGGHSDQLSRSSWGNDVYRVRSLVKILDACGNKELLLDDVKIKATREILLSKCEVLKKGFLKHGNPERSKYYEGLQQTYSL